jgi:hypothetical protein
MLQVSLRKSYTEISSNKEIQMAFDKDALPVEKLAETFAYEAETGKIYWKLKTASKVLVGAEAGCTKATKARDDGSKGAYRYVRAFGKSMPAQRVAWALHYGEWPLGKIYFEDGDQLNLKINNLRQSNTVSTPHDMNTSGGRADYQREYRANEGMDWKDGHLRSKFGITLAEYGQMLVAQNGKCAICNGDEMATRGGKPKALAVDHDHSTGKVRALLCSECNQMLGKAKDNRDILLAAVKYLDKHAGRDSKPNLTVVQTEETN